MTKYLKPEGFQGRGKGAKTYNKLKWEIIMYDKESNRIKTGKFSSKEQMIAEMKLDLSPDHIYRLSSGKKVDETKRLKDSSFLEKYGHIQITKIDESKKIC